MRRLSRVNGLEIHRRLGRLRDRAFVELIRRDFEEFGARSSVRLPTRIWGERRIAVGDDVVIGESSWIYALPTGRIDIGSGTRMSGLNVLSAVDRISIGERVLFGRSVYVSDHNHGRSSPGAAIMDQGVDDVAAVRIDDGAWLGQGVIVLPGVTIGRGAVIAANAVVRSDVPARHIAAGVPARVVRELD